MIGRVCSLVVTRLPAINGGKDLFHPPLLIELVERSQAVGIQKQLRRPPDSLAARPQARRAGDQLAIEQRLDGGGALDAADGVDVAG